MAARKIGIAAIERKAASNALEVEHLLSLARDADASVAPVLRELSARHGWSSSEWVGKKRVVPLGRWAEVVSEYLERGHSGVVAMAKGRRTRETHAVMCIDLLSELHTPESVEALIRIGKPVWRDPTEDVELALALANAFNLLLSFKHAPAIPDATRSSIRGFLHRLLELDLDDSQRASCVCALRGVGDARSLDVIRALPPFEHPWAGLENLAIRQITRRNKRSS
jgi:hypothetical protein